MNPPALDVRGDPHLPTSRQGRNDQGQAGAKCPFLLEQITAVSGLDEVDCVPTGKPCDKRVG